MSDTTSTELATIVVDEGVRSAIQGLAAGRSSVFSTIEGNDPASKLALLKAVTSSVPLADNLGKVLNIVNFVVQPIEMTNDTTGVVAEVPRIVFIDDKGVAYHAISGPLFKSVENVLGIMGKPSSWDKPLAAKFTREGSGNSKYFAMSIV